MVTDTSPLFTLVLADALDLLVRPGLPVLIPDAVYVEATRVRGAPGAGEIVAWVGENFDDVRIVPTETGVDQQRRLEEGRHVRGLGERAALEAMDRFLERSGDAEALLLFEDSDISRRHAVLNTRASLISIGDFLRELEFAGLLQSVEHVLDLAAKAGRNVDRQRRLASDADTLARFGRQMRTR